jgi:hypothetical protein
LAVYEAAHNSGGGDASGNAAFAPRLPLKPCTAESAVILSVLQVICLRRHRRAHGRDDRETPANARRAKAEDVTRRDVEMAIFFVVPAKAGTHTPRRLF